MSGPRVLVLFGGRSGEHEVSVSSARAVARAVEELGHTLVTVGITMDGRWVRGDPRDGDAVDPGGEPYPFSVDPTAREDVDVVFPVFHGPYGEDGSIQGLLELADLSYVGADVEGSVLCLNKALQKRLFSDAGLTVVDHVALTREAWDADRAGALAGIDGLGSPCYSKPARLGSSVGTSRIATPDDVADAVDRAFRHDDLVLVEAEGGSHELEVAVLEVDDDLELSVVGRPRPPEGFYDYESKYADDRTVLEIPAEIPDAVVERIRGAARTAFRVTGCGGLARVDFFWDPATDRLVTNEINSIPGMTPTSMFPRLWEASGRPFARVVDALLAHARRRHERKGELHAAREAAHEVEVGGGASG